MTPTRRCSIACLTCCAIIAASGCALTQPQWIAHAPRAMVAADSADASRAGLEILRAGGNAIDAAAAVSFALGVTRPYSTGVGGGGFMIVRLANGRTVVLDYRETAPSAATADMYAGAPPRASRNGRLAVATPGVVAGQSEALRRFGTMPLDRILQPALRLAREGYQVDRHYVDACRSALRQYEQDPTLRDGCGYVYRTHLRQGKLPRTGDVLRQPELARFLENLVRGGEDFFYRGPFAAALHRGMIDHGGRLRASDLDHYRVRRRRPLVGTYRGRRIVAMPPPSSGGVAIIQTLNTLESFDMPTLYRTNPTLATHYLIEAMKHAFADRARWLADSDFLPVPVEKLTSKDYARHVAQRIDTGQPIDSESYGFAPPPDDSGTSHYCVVDRWGNVVVATETINTAFGSLAAVDEWGVILNNQMDDFTARPGRPNAYGLIQSDRNAVAPGKRPLSSMSPTIVLENGQPLLMLGASGGPRIISSVLNVMLGILDDDRSLAGAVAAPRAHHQWLPDEVFFDKSPGRALVAGLKAKGHRISDVRRSGAVQAILRTPDGWTGASDPRKGGIPAGY